MAVGIEQLFIHRAHQVSGLNVFAAIESTGHGIEAAAATKCLLVQLLDINGAEHGGGFISHTVGALEGLLGQAARIGSLPSP